MSNFKDLDALLQKYVDDGLPGCGMVIAKKGEILYEKYFGYADVLRNLNKYYDNATDGPENPFISTPLRSPLDNINLSITLAYRFNKDGFDEWFYKPRRRDRRTKEFKFSQSGDMQ